MPKRFTPRGVHAIISLWKNELIDPDEAHRRAQNIFDRKHADVYAEYQARLHKAGAMDFDDLLTNTVKLFREHPDVLEHYRQRFEHILVDEYQDTNQAQNETGAAPRRRPPQRLRGGRHGSVSPAGHDDRRARRATPIEHRAIGDRVHGVPRHARVETGTVHVHEGRYDGHIVEIEPPSDRTVRATPHHLVPARLLPRPEQWLVYLMYRADRGWRVGRTVGARPSRGNAARPRRAHQPGARRRRVDPEGVRTRWPRPPTSSRSSPPSTACRPPASTPPGGRWAWTSPGSSALRRSIDTETRRSC
jgi:DNA helicase II / ATP-dependent DNA helicase PcrA